MLVFSAAVAQPHPTSPDTVLAVASVEAARADRLPALAWLLAALPAFLLYLFTLSPTVLLGDMGEFQFTGYILGVPHPTGYPLYTLLSKLFTFLPVGDIAYRVNLSSAVYMGAAAGMIAASIVVLLTRQPAPDAAERREAVRLAALLWGVACGLLFAVSGTVWDQAVLARSYALNALLVSSIILVLLLYWTRPHRRLFFLFWLLLGLSLAHHGTTLTLLPGYLVFVAYCVLRIAHLGTRDGAGQKIGRSFWRSLTQYAIRNIPLAILGLLLGLSPYLLFAYRFVFGYSYYWGNPQSWADVWSLLRGTPFQSQVLAYPLTPDAQWERVLFGSGQIADQFGMVGAAGIVIGLLFLLLSRTHRPVVLLLLLLWLGNFVFAINYGIIGHIYLIPGYVVGAILLGMLPLPLLLFGARAISVRSAFVGVGALALMALAVWVGLGRYAAHDMSNNRAVADLAETTLREAAPDAKVYVDWESISVFRYYQYAEGRRTDLQLESGNPDGWDEEIAADLVAGRPAYVGGFAGPAPPAAVSDAFSLSRVGLVYRVVGRK